MTKNIAELIKATPKDEVLSTDKILEMYKSVYSRSNGYCYYMCGGGLFNG